MTERDADLLRRWEAGDHAAGKQLADAHFGVVYRFFVTKLDDGVDDLVQQTFMAAVAGASRFDPTRGSVRAFLLGIARRELLALRRKQARESRALLREGAHQPVQSSPSGPLVRRQELRLLLNALRELPLELQIVLELHYWEDLTVAEVAQVVEIPAGTVKSRLARARQQLRERIAAADAPAEIVRSTVDGLERWAGALRDQLTRT